MGDVIHAIFAGRKPETVDTAFWEWGQGFIQEGVLDLQAVVRDIATADNPHTLCAAVRELKQMVEDYPDCIEYPK